MKKSMIFAILALAAIVIVSSFGWQLFPTAPVAVPESAAGTALFVCPTTSGWDTFAENMHPFNKYIVGGFFFVAILLMFNWIWAMYQNLLKDKFDRNSFKNVWQYTKLAFWAAIIVLIAAKTPNYFRKIHIQGASGNWVLCESNSPGARAVRSSAVNP